MNRIARVMAMNDDYTETPHRTAAPVNRGAYLNIAAQIRSSRSEGLVGAITSAQIPNMSVAFGRLRGHAEGSKRCMSYPDPTKAPTSLPDPDTTTRSAESSRKACRSRVCCL